MTSTAQTPLLKKHSQTDLVSRLKSRKMLGVGGEDDEGEVHRSKISQVLGNETKFTGRQPLGLRFWIFFSAVVFTVASVMTLAFPSQLYEMLSSGGVSATRVSIRLYGGALLCLCLILWNGLHTAEKVIVEWTLLTEACYLGVQILVTSITLLEMSLLSSSVIIFILSQVLFFIVTLCYYFHLGRRTKKALV